MCLYHADDCKILDEQEVHLFGNQVIHKVCTGMV